jgi:hypothetical protein
MGLYNILFGEHPMSRYLMAMLNLKRVDVGRYRDCYITKWGGETEADKTLRIAAFTRNGGGNRDDYQHVTEALQAHPNYVTDFDDDFDCTYATYIFDVPEEYKEMVEFLSKEMVDDPPPMEKFMVLIKKLQEKGEM